MMTPQEKFAFLQEVLPKIDIYLIKDLAKEKLSRRVENERLNYVKILESLLPPVKQSIDAAPRLPNRPTKATEQKQSVDDCKSEYVITTSQPEQDLYEDVSGGVGSGNNRFQSNTQLHQSDRPNASDKQPTGPANTKGSTSSNDGGYYDVSELRRTSDSSLHSDATCSAELYLRGGGNQSYTKRYCVLKGSTLSCYKSAQDPKPVKPIHDLVECDVSMSPRNDANIGKNAVSGYELRISKPGHEMYWLFTEKKPVADRWLKELRAASGKDANAPSGDEDSGQISSEEFSDIEDTTPYANDDQIGTPQSDDTTKDRGNAGKLVKKAWKGFLAHGSSLITSASGTLTRKMKTKDPKSPTDTIEPPDSIIAGQLEVCLCFTEPSKSWSIKYVVVQNGHLNIYRSSHDERAECSLMLAGTTLLPAEDKVKRQLTIRLWHPEEQKDICLDFDDRKMEHGRWMDILVKQVKFKAPAGYTKPSSEQQPFEQSEYEDLPDEETLAAKMASQMSRSASTGDNSEEYENVFMDRSKRPLPAAPSSPGDDEPAGSATPGPSLAKVRTTPNIATQNGSSPAMPRSLSGNALAENRSKFDGKAMTLPRNMLSGNDSTRKRFDDSKWKPTGSSTNLSTTNKTDSTVTKSGQLNVSVNYSTPLKSFYNRFCVIKDGNFVVYENPRDTKVICSVGLAGADVSESQKVTEKHLIIKTRQNDRTQEICIKFSVRKEDQVEMKQWSEIIKERSRAGSRNTYLSASMPNDDRAEYELVSTNQPPPPLPASSPPSDEYCNQDQISSNPVSSNYEEFDVPTAKQQKPPTSPLRAGGFKASSSARSTVIDCQELKLMTDKKVVQDRLKEISAKFNS